MTKFLTNIKETLIIASPKQGLTSICGLSLFSIIPFCNISKALFYFFFMFLADFMVQILLAKAYCGRNFICFITTLTNSANADCS